MVTCHVCGMIATSNQYKASLCPTTDTVNDTPSTVIEPFSADLLDHGIARWIPKDQGLRIVEQRSVFGRLYQVLLIEKAAA